MAIPTRNLATVIGYGLLSARAAAANAGHLYYATDTKTLSRDNGATWDDLASVQIIVNATDPGAVGAWSFWLDISTPATPLLKTRNAGDTAWIVLSPDLSPYMLASAITANQIAALAGTGTPSGTDKYVNDSDSRMTNARTPTGHHATHDTAGSDPIAPADIGAVVTGDSRLSDARTPTAHASTHNHGGSDALAEDAVAATPSLRSLGTGATQAASGTDGRLSDARTPTAHASTHNHGGSDALAEDAVAATPSLRSLGTGAQQAASGTDARFTGTGETGGLLVVWNGNSFPLIATGSGVWVEIPFGLVLDGASLAADVATGYCSVNISYAATYGALPTVSSIVASAHPALSASQFYQDNALTTWTKTLNARGWLYIELGSVDTISRLTLSLHFVRS